MGNIHEYKIDIDVKENLLITVICKQMDNINFIFNVWDNGLQAELSNYNCRLKALKSDYVPLIQNTGITISKNIISIIADEQLTTTSGIVKAELQFIDKITGEKKSTFNLSLKVVASVLEVDRTISKSTVTLLEDLDNKLDQIADISDILDEAKEVKEELKIDIVTSNTVKDNLNTCIHNADTKKQEIETVTNNVDNKKLEVETSINNVNTAKMELDTSKSNADKTKINLDNANIQAEKNIEELNKLGDVTDLAEKVQINTTDITQLKTDASNNTTQLNDIANNNLLINSDFVNPINQRQKTTYNEWRKYTIDRWLNQTKKVEVQSDGILITMDVQYGNIVQKFENANIFKGKVVTLSGELEVINGSVYSELNVQDSNNNNTLYCNKAFDVGAHKFSIKSILNEDITSIFLGITNGNTGESKVKLKWLKLEFGSKATPFTPRSYGEELALCMRYYEPLVHYKTYGIAVTHATDGTKLYCSLEYSPKRIKPNITFASQDSFAIGTASGAISSKSIAILEVDFDRVLLEITLNGSVTPGQAFLLQRNDSSSNSSVFIDAGIY